MLLVVILGRIGRVLADMEEAGQGLSEERGVSRNLKEAKETSPLKIPECSEQKRKEQVQRASGGSVNGEARVAGMG